MSRRHTDAAVLEAARICAAEVGVRRTTVADVARRAGASRMTVYRLFPDAKTLWSTLLTREFEQVMSDAEAGARHLPTALERLVEMTVVAVAKVGEDPLVRRVLELDTELLVPYILERLGRSQRLAMARFRELLDEGRRDGSMRPVDGETVAYCLQLIVGSFVLATRVTEHEAKPQRVSAEIRRLLTAYLQAPRSSAS
jgi:AcrR family transcriptional regulator